MKPFLSLLKLSFKSLLINSTNLGRRKGKKSRSVSGVGALLLLCGLCLYLSGTYALLLGSSYGPLGGLDIMLGIMTIMGLFFPLTFVLFAAQSLVFSTKDADLMLSLPVSSFSVMLSRVLALYLESFLMVELMLLPAGISYSMNGGENGVAVLLTMLVQGIFLSLVPTLLALVFGSIVALVVSRLRFKNLITVLFSLVLVVGIMVGSFTISGSAASAEVADLNGLRSTLFAFAPLGWAVQGALGNIGQLLLLAIFCIVPFFLVVWVFSRFYKGILTRLGSHHLRNDYKVKDLKARGAFSALFAKELKRFFGTPAFLLNSGISILLLIVACVAAVIYKTDIDQVMALLFGPAAAGQYVPPLLLGVMCLMTSFTFISCVSISLEGKTLWILKAAPISLRRVFAAKWGVNFLIEGFCCVVCYPLLAYAFSLGVLDFVLMLLFNLLLSLFGSVLGLYINLLLPRLDADNDTVVIKQSASAMVASLVSLVFVGLLVGLYFLLGANFSLFLWVGAPLLALLSVGMLALLNSHGQKLFAAL